MNWPLCKVEHPPSSAHVKIVTANNASFADAFQFDDADDTSWNFSSKTFRMDVKGNPEQDAALISFTSGAAQIVVDDVTLRILHFNVADTVLRAALVPGSYFFDLIMVDSITTVRTALMHGEFVLTDGITGD